jgi:hypothetical protein
MRFVPLAAWLLVFALGHEAQWRWPWVRFAFLAIAATMVVAQGVEMLSAWSVSGPAAPISYDDGGAPR